MERLRRRTSIPAACVFKGDNLIRQFKTIKLILLCCVLSACINSAAPAAAKTAVGTRQMTASSSDPSTGLNSLSAGVQNLEPSVDKNSDGSDAGQSKKADSSPHVSSPEAGSYCEDENGSLESGRLASDLMGASMEYQVYLPPCYGGSLDNRYPVLYLLHGQGYTQKQWEQLGAVELADEMISTNQVSPFIMVMPREAVGAGSRRSAFDQAVAQELVPFVDKTYRTKPAREFRAVGGISRGAGWAVELGTHHWDLFGAFGAHSPAVFNNNATLMSNLLDAVPADKYPRIFIDTGASEPPSIIEAAEWLGELLNQKGVPHEWYRFSGVHNDSYWRKNLELYLRWYTGSW